MPVDSKGRWVSRSAGGSSLKASGAETASTSGTWTDFAGAASVEFNVVVSAVSGTTPTMLVDIYGSPDGTNGTAYKIATIGGNGYSLANGADPGSITATGTYRALIPTARFIQYRSRIGGTTPSFTYSITDDAS